MEATCRDIPSRCSPIDGTMDGSHLRLPVPRCAKGGSAGTGHCIEHLAAHRTLNRLHIALGHLGGG
jgi:hypothetical protein